MKRKKLWAGIAICAAVLTGGIIYAADHLDSPAVSNQTTDITDVYVFRGQDPNNLVFVGNTQGLLSPSATGTAKFDANTLIELSDLFAVPMVAPFIILANVLLLCVEVQ